MTARGIVWILTMVAAGLLCSRPALAQVSVIGSLSRQTVVQPGQTIRGVVLVRNASDTPQEVKASQTDYRYFADGRNLYEEAGSTGRSNARWVVVTPKRMSVPPNATASFEYSVQVPADNKMVGTYWSMIMIEPIPRSSPESIRQSKTPGEATMGITTQIRYGVQIVTHIGSTGAAEIHFLDKRLVRANGVTALEISAENRGTRSLYPSIWAEVYNASGASLGRFKGAQVAVHPSCSFRQQINFPDVPKGKYKCLVVLDSGTDTPVGARYDLIIQ